MSVADSHRSHAPAARSIRVAVVTCSDSREPATDVGGRLVADLAVAAGFVVFHRVVLPDEPDQIRAHVRQLVDGGDVRAVLLTGGTGLSGRDGTVEAVRGLFDKELPGYGELFRWLSFQAIGPAAMLSRAAGGTCGSVAVFLMPGSPAAVRLAMERLILPELAHVVGELSRHPRAADAGASHAMPAFDEPGMPDRHGK